MRKPLLLLAVAFLAAACSGGRQHTRWLGLDTAQYHLQTGTLFLERDMPEDARRELALAVACAKLGRYAEGREHLARARWLARDDVAKCQTKVAEIRLLLIERPSGWLEAAQDLYLKASSLCPEDKAPAYFMALGYKAALRLERAEELLREVALAGAAYGGEAAAEWRLVQRVLRCSPRTELGRELASRQSISRAELAALLFCELGLGRAWGGREVPGDLEEHRLKGQVLPVVMLDLEPLVTFADGTFHPDTPVTRAEFARVIEKILSGWSQGRLCWREPARSPYPDVPKETPGYRALMLCGARGLLEVRDLFTGALDPNGPLSGADALLAIGRLREQQGAK